MEQMSDLFIQHYYYFKFQDEIQSTFFNTTMEH